MASKTIEARLVISGEDRASNEIAKVVKAFKEAEKAVAFSDKVEKLGKAYTDVERQMRAAGAVMSARGPLEATVKNLAAAEKEASRLAKEYDVARKAVTDFTAAQKVAKTADAVQQAAALNAEVKRLGTAYRSAEKDVKQLGAAFSSQTSTLRAAEAEAGRLGVKYGSLERHQATLARQTDLATRALRAQIAAEEMGAKASAARAQRSAQRREAVGTIAAGAGIIAAHRGKEIGLAAIQSVASFDIAVRKQKEFTDISDADQAQLLKQAKKIGQETQFSNEDVVKAQTASMQGLPANFAPDLKAAVAKGIVDNVRNYATLMETDLKDGAEVIRSYLQMTGKDISTKEKALSEANKATNQLVKMAKLGGMNGEDVDQFVKLAMSSGTTSGLTTDSLMSLAALAKRGGLRGDEAGTFIKTSAGKLVSPTKKGLAAWNAAGVNHSGFVKMPDQLSTSALEGQFRMDLGRGFTPAIRRRIDQINSDKSLIGDQGRYTEAITKAVEGILDKKKNGEVRASDRQVAAKAVGNFYKVAAQSVDVEGLLDALMKANPTLAQLNAIFTGAHGGKAAITQRQWDEFKASRQEIAKAGDDPDYAAKKAREVMAGVGGSIENMKGSFENFTLAVGEANKGLIKFTADSLGNLVDKFSELPQEQQQALSLGAGAVGLGGGAFGAYKLTRNLLGFGPAALNGSAAALTKSAALLDAAAIKLAGGSPSDLLKDGGKVAAGGLLGAGATAAGVVLGGAAASVIANEAVKNKDFAKAYTGDGKSDDGGMLGADPAGYGLGAGILGAPDHSVPMAPTMSLAPGAMPMTIQGSGISAFGLSGPTDPSTAGKEAGEKAGKGVADGIEAKAPEVEAQGKSLFQRLKDTFSQGIFVPINFVPGGVGDPGGGSLGGGAGGGGLIHRASFGGGGGAGASGSPSGHVPAVPMSVQMSEAERNFLGLVNKYESGGRNVPNYINDRTHTAQGYYQITNTNWRRLAPRLGISARNAMAASMEDQTRVALALKRESGMGNWTRYNPRLRGALSRGEQVPVQGVLKDAAALDPKLVKDANGTEGLDLGDGTMRMPDGRIRPIPRRSSLEIPDAPAAGFGGGRRGIGQHVEEFGRHVDRLAGMGFDGKVQVALTGPGAQHARVTSMRARGRGGMSADMGLSMPGAKESDDDWS